MLNAQEKDMAQLILSIVNNEATPETALGLICAYCFGDRENVMNHIIKGMAGNTAATTGALLGRQAIKTIRNKDILTAKEVATIFCVSPQNVSAACRDGRIADADRVRTTAGWFILRSAAEKVWSKTKGGDCL